MNPTPDSTSPKTEAADLSPEMLSAIDAELAKASAPAEAPAPAAASAGATALGTTGSRPAIRGPRVVQGGREHRTGAVVSVGPTDIFIEFGPKELGVVSRIQFTDADLPKVGDQLAVVVQRFEAGESLLICARPGTVQKADWELLEPGQVVEARVTGVNKGGLELEVANHQAFMPASQIDVRRIEDLSVYVGQKLKCTVTRVDRTGRGNITLSRRDIVAQESREQAEKLKESLSEGQTREVTIRKIMPFGAFADLGGVDGLIHITDLSHDRVRRVEDHVKEGQTVRVKILKIDWDNKRISLGLKQLVDDPFDTATKDATEGAIVTGRVTNIAEFGAFVEIGPGVEGLIHISELAWHRVGKVSDVLQPSQVITVKVLKVDKESRKISLSLKQATERPAEEAASAGAPGSSGSGPGGGGPGSFGRGGRDGGSGFPDRGFGGGKRLSGRITDSRKPEEILKETPALRRAREKFKALQKAKGGSSGEGLKGGY